MYAALRCFVSHCVCVVAGQTGARETCPRYCRRESASDRLTRGRSWTRHDDASMDAKENVCCCLCVCACCDTDAQSAFVREETAAKQTDTDQQQRNAGSTEVDQFEDAAPRIGLGFSRAESRQHREPSRDADRKRDRSDHRASDPPRIERDEFGREINRSGDGERRRETQHLKRDRDAADRHGRPDHSRRLDANPRRQGSSDPADSSSASMCSVRCAADQICCTHRDSLIL